MSFYSTGSSFMPQAIETEISDGEVFTIGRFDPSVGKKQSSFEFSKIFKSISRIHALVENDSGVFKIIDLASSNGTFVNDWKIPPNTPFLLSPGTRVSFGSPVFEYIWEPSNIVGACHD